MSVQRIMWNLVRGTNKTYYVSNPAKGGGLHNYGMAVDLTIIDASGKLLPEKIPEKKSSIIPGAILSGLLVLTAKRNRSFNFFNASFIPG